MICKQNEMHQVVSFINTYFPLNSLEDSIRNHIKRQTFFKYQLPFERYR